MNDIKRTNSEFDVESVREKFPILHQTVNGQPLVYLDNAATTQKPLEVIDSINRYYTQINSNIHRGVHHLSEKATEAYESARINIANFINAPSSREVIFVRGGTEAINLVAHSFGRKFINPGDEILITAMEHHANIVPWQLACEEFGGMLKVVPVDDKGVLDYTAFEKLLSEKTRLVSVVHVSNALGTINPIKKIIEKAHTFDIPVLVDGAQSVPHFPIDITALDCDFFVFSGHKVFGPTGIGILYGKEKWLDAMPPYQGGGDMIQKVTFEKTTYKKIPEKFEAGTPHISGVIGLEKALNFLGNFDRATLMKYENDLLSYATESLNSIDGLHIVGTSPNKSGVISFLLDSIHPHDIGTFLDQDGIAIRAGHHCAQPLMRQFGISGTARASFSLYNSREEVDKLHDAIIKTKKFFLSN